MSSRDSSVEDAVQIVAGLAVLVIFIYLIALVGAVILVLAPPVVGFMWWYNKRKHERHLQTLTDDTTSLHERVTNLRDTFFDASEDELVAHVVEVLEINASERGIERAALDLDGTLAHVFVDLYYNYALPAMPELTGNFAGVDGLRIRMELRELEEMLDNPREAREQFLETTAIVLLKFLQALPDDVFTDTDSGRSLVLRQPASLHVSDLGDLIEDVISTFHRNGTSPNKVGYPIRNALFQNVCIMSGIPEHKLIELRAEHARPPTKQLIFPSTYKGERNATVYGYLAGTPLLDLFDAPVPLPIPDEVRFEHHWIVAPPGIGKSTALQYFIERDLERVARDEASIIVMDSKRDLYRAIVGLKRFAPGGDLEGKLLAIDTEDVEWPLALNVFDIGLETGDEPRNAYDQESLYNSAISMLDYVFRALLGAELTSRQSTLFNFTVQLLLQLPNPTLDTLVDLMQPGAVERYREYLPKLSDDAQAYFETKFDADNRLRETKSQVVDRIFAIKRNRTLSKMFSAPRSKLNLFEEMSSAKVILINYPKSLLQEEGCEIFSRFMLANILMAAQKRQLLASAKRLPTFLYIDECQDVIRRDEKISVFLDQARGFRVGCVLAHQRLDQLESKVFNALLGSTAIKFASHVSEPSSPALARSMSTEVDFISKQPRYSFACHIRRHTDSALSIRIPHVDMERMPRMTEDEAREVRNSMRERYSVHAIEAARSDRKSLEAPPPETYVDPDGDEHVDTSRPWPPA